MDAYIDKRSNSGFSGWSVRCYRMRGCELIQYKKIIDDFQKAKDNVIKQRYNLYDINSVYVSSKQPLIIRVNTSQYSSEITLKFNDVQKHGKKQTKILEFIAWYRILTCSTRIIQNKTNKQCLEKPIPSNYCFSLYYLLQKLYKHQELCNTPYLFSKKNTRNASSQQAQITKLLYSLLVNSHQHLSNIKTDTTSDINILSKTLLYTLENMPTSLFCDSYCKDLSDTIIKIINKNKLIIKKQQNNIEPNNKMDKDILYAKNSISIIKTKLLHLYSATKKDYKEKWGFHNFNRYGFLSLLFLLLNYISSTKNYKHTKLSCADLGAIFSKVLQSKKYLFNIRTNKLIQQQYGEERQSKYDKSGKRDVIYEKNFEIVCKVLIYYAKEIFPPINKVKWKIHTLIHEQGQ